MMYLFSHAVGRISEGLKNEFELATVNESTEFEVLRFYCTYVYHDMVKIHSGYQGLTDSGYV